MTTTNHLLIAAPLLTLVAVALATDLRYRIIPNGLSLGGAVVGLATQAALFGPAGFFFGLLGWIVCLVCFLPFYARGGMAAGDVKLMAAVGAFLGPWYGFVACLCTLVAGALIGLLVLCVKSLSLSVRVALSTIGVGTGGSASGGTTAFRPSLEDGIPYAAAIAAGATTVIVQPSVLMPLLAIGGQQ